MHAKLTESVRTCNERMRIVESRLELVQIESTLDVSRLVEAIPLEAPGRSLLKRGPLELITLNNRKVSKSKPVEIMLFSDLLMYAKPVKVRKTGTLKYIVYKQVHRSLIEIGDVPPDQLPDTGDYLFTTFSITLYSDDMPTTLVVRASSSSDRTRWQDTFNPPKQEDEIYAVWDCPKAQVLYDYNARGTDELPLTAGDLVNITNRKCARTVSRPALM